MRARDSESEEPTRNPSQLRSWDKNPQDFLMPSPLLLPWDNGILETPRQAPQKASIRGAPESKERSDVVSRYEWGDLGITGVAKKV